MLTVSLVAIHHYNSTGSHLPLGVLVAMAVVFAILRVWRTMSRGGSGGGGMRMSVGRSEESGGSEVDRTL